MRKVHYCGLVALLLALPGGVRAQGSGGLNSGGGTRSGGGFQVVDALGAAVSGEAASANYQAASGFISGLPVVTPVALRVFHVELGPQGVTVQWEAAEARRFSAFFLERAKGSEDTPPQESDYVRFDARFSGPGPHSYVDAEVEVGKTYYYRLIWISDPKTPDIIGPWSVFIDPSAAPKPVQIYAAHPNPFKEGFVVSLFLSEPSALGWSLHDLQGRLVLQGGIGRVPSGFHSHLVTPLQPLSGGVYFLRVIAGRVSHVQKIIALP